MLTDVAIAKVDFLAYFHDWKETNSADLKNSLTGERIYTRRSDS